jgi:hypothetical protein
MIHANHGSIKRRCRQVHHGMAATRRRILTKFAVQLDSRMACYFSPDALVTLNKGRDDVGRQCRELQQNYIDSFEPNRRRLAANDLRPMLVCSRGKIVRLGDW